MCPSLSLLSPVYKSATHNTTTSSSLSSSPKMAAASSSVLPLLLFLLLLSASGVLCRREMELLQMAHTQVHEARTWVEGHRQIISAGGVQSSMLSSSLSSSPAVGVALEDCAKLYEESEQRLKELVYEKPGHDDMEEDEEEEDEVTWVSGVMSSHRACLDGLEEKGHNVEAQGLHKNLTSLLGEALQLYAKNKNKAKPKPKPKSKCLE